MVALAAGVERLPFVTKASDTMHIDVNSCFATIEQQCNALLRDKPVAVAAYTTPRGCILSPSVEAKRFGIKTGMRVMEGKHLCPDLIVLPTDPPKYRWVNRQLQRLFAGYSPSMQMLSIDEAVLRFFGLPFSVCSLQSVPNEVKNDPVNQPASRPTPTENRSLEEIAVEIKQRIHSEIGDWLRVSVGIGPNRWLAKMAAGLHKPDGLEELNWWNVENVLDGLALEDLHGINRGNAERLRKAGLLRPRDVYQADIPTLRRAFQSILGFQWHLKMRGYECDDRPVQRRSFSHVYSLPRPAVMDEDVAAVVSKMMHSLAYRLQHAGYQARGLYVGLWFGQGLGWGRHHVGVRHLFDQADLYAAVMGLVAERPRGLEIKRVSCGCFDLEPTTHIQTTWLSDEVAKQRRAEAIVSVQQRYGKYALMPARMLQIHHKGWLKDAISFGGIGELEDLPFEESAEVEEVEDQEAMFWEG